MSSYLPVLVRRGQRWERAYAAGDEKSARLKRFVRKGIPNRWVAWVSVDGGLPEQGFRSVRPLTD